MFYRCLVGKLRYKGILRAIKEQDRNLDIIIYRICLLVLQT